MQARRFKALEDMMEHIIGNAHGLRPEELAAEAAKSGQREMPSIHVSGGHVVFAIYGNLSGPINIYKQGEEETISGRGSSTSSGDVS